MAAVAAEPEILAVDATNGDGDVVVVEEGDAAAASSDGGSPVESELRVVSPEKMGMSEELKE